MKKYEVEITAIYNGIVTIEANSEEEARCKVEDQLYGDNLAGLPDYVNVPIGEGGHFSFGEATADYADEIECQD